MPALEIDDVRQRRLLDAAVATFVRFGFRKTSMEEVARAARMSRQGIYLHYPAKDELFRAAVEYALKSGLEAARACFRDESASLEAKLVGGFDAWIGRYVGMMGADVADLEEAIDALLGSLLREYEDAFAEMALKAVRAAGLSAAYKPAGVSGRELVQTLDATARGLKHLCRTRAEFGERFSVAVRALCLPLLATA